MRTQKELFNCLDSIATKCQQGVMLEMERAGPIPSPIPEVPIIPTIPLSPTGPLDTSTVHKCDPPPTIQQPQSMQSMQQPPLTASAATLAWSAGKRLILVPRFKAFHWPIPEAYWPFPHLDKLVGGMDIICLIHSC